jgi:hypothetical protein
MVACFALMVESSALMVASSALLLGSLALMTWAEYRRSVEPEYRFYPTRSRVQGNLFTDVHGNLYVGERLLRGA